GIPPMAVHTHHIGIPLPDRSPTRSPTFPQEILCIGRFVQKKGHRILLEAFAGLGEGYPAHLKLIGDGPLRPAIKSQIDALGLHAKVTLTGWLEPDAVQRDLARASALVLPSIVASDGDTEGLPTTLLEAGALALPVISTDTGGVSELVSSDALGFVVPPGQVDALTQMIKACLEAPLDAREKALRLQTKIRAEFDCAKQTCALEALYDEAIAAHRRRG
ncbi:MAG: glycosyltransferase, partial [Pseudomonadota bacterium]